MSWDGKTLKIDNANCVKCMHCINAMPKALRPGKDRGAIILVGAKAPIVEGALLSSVLVPFIKLEPPYDELKDLLERIWEFWGEHGKNRERVGELIQRVGLGNFLEAIELEPVPEMIAHPRENPYVFYEEYFEEEEEEEEEQEEQRRRERRERVAFRAVGVRPHPSRRRVWTNESILRLQQGKSPMAMGTKRRTDIGPPNYERFLPPVIKANYGKWKYHEILKPGVMVHVAESGDKLFTVRAASPRLLSIKTLRRFADLADKYCGGHLRFTSRHNVEFLLTDQAKIDALIGELKAMGHPVGGLGNSISNIVHTQGWVHCHSAATDASGHCQERHGRFARILRRA